MLTFETFALLGYYSSAVTAIAYAARHPERVTRLVLFGGTMRLLDAMSDPGFKFQSAQEDHGYVVASFVSTGQAIA